MRPSRLLLTLALVLGLSGVAYVAQLVEPAGAKMCSAGDKFLGSLSDEQKQKALYQFDDPERTKWHYVPLQDSNKRPTRKGLPLEDMNDGQKQAALDLLRAGTSDTGYKKATTIMSLESILRELEKGGAMVRNPQWYFFTLFGTPSKDGKWGWRVEGHHLSLNFVVDQGKVTAATPAFFGANPATVKDGPRKGLRTLPEAEDLALELFNSLDDDQKKIAHQEKLYDKAPNNDIEQEKAAPTVGEPKGLPAAQMTDQQRSMLIKLLRAYGARMPEDVIQVATEQIKEAGIEKVHFAFSGGAKPGVPHSYRLQGPTFVIEFLNVQKDSAGNLANHIHSAWRNMSGDFGIPRK